MSINNLVGCSLNLHSVVIHGWSCSRNESDVNLEFQRRLNEIKPLFLLLFFIFIKIMVFRNDQMELYLLTQIGQCGLIYGHVHASRITTVFRRILS